MMIRLRLFGHEIFRLDMCGDSYEDDEVTDADVEEIVKKISGGPWCDTERDPSPLVPGLDKDYDSWADRPFGFKP